MIKDIIKFLLPLLLLSGCALFKPMTEEEKRVYKLLQEKKEFLQREQSSMAFTIDSDTQKSATMLLDAHTPLMYIFELPEFKEIASVELSISAGWNVKRILIPKKDYFWDSINQELFIPVTVPYIYLLDNEVIYRIDMIGTTKEYSMIQSYKEVSFWHKPLKDNDESYVSFEYVDSLTALNIDPFIKAMLRDEIENLDTKRISKSTRKTVLRLKEEL